MPSGYCLSRDFLRISIYGFRPRSMSALHRTTLPWDRQRPPDRRTTVAKRQRRGDRSPALGDLALIIPVTAPRSWPGRTPWPLDTVNQKGG